MADDVVARLRSWVTDWNGAAMVRGEPPRDGLHCDDVYDAIDEIVALRKLTDGDWVWKQITDTRNEALEEAARECDEEAKGSGGEVAFRDGCETCAAAIRLLKDKP